MGAKVIILAKSLIPIFLRACAIVHCISTAPLLIDKKCATYPKGLYFVVSIIDVLRIVWRFGRSCFIGVEFWRS